MLFRFPRRGNGSGGSRLLSRGKLLVALVVAGFALFSYFSQRQQNAITGETQFISMTADQEVALGLQAAPEMIAKHGGLFPDPQVQAMVDRIGKRLVTSSKAKDTPYRWDFHVLADDRTINAFALPGGQVFITTALLRRLKTEGQVAGVIGHEIGHVVGRHGAERLSKAKLTQGLTGAAVIATYDPSNPASRKSAAVAAMIGQVVNMHYGRGHELESDKLGVRFLARAGYDPRAMVGVMEVLAEAAGSKRSPEFFSTHPNPERRIDRIKEAIDQTFPDGLPPGLVP